MDEPQQPTPTPQPSSAATTSSESLEKDTPSAEALTSVKVPTGLRADFLNAQKYVERYFADKKESPQKGIIDISGERYILVRAASMSHEFFELMTTFYQDRGPKEARNVIFGFLYDMAHSIAKADARSFFTKLGVTDPIARLSAGPIHFAHTGWAYVDILPESNPTPDEHFYLIYDHPFSFEADSWQRNEKQTDFPVCIMNAGYSSGWCEESFGIPLVAAEIECRSKGDPRCRFIMAPPHKIKDHIARYSQQPHRKEVDFGDIDIPEFFQRKRLEDELRKEKEFNATIIQTSPAFFVAIAADGRTLLMNDAMLKTLGYTADEVVDKNYLKTFVPRKQWARLIESFRQIDDPDTIAVDRGEMITKDGLKRLVEWHGRRISNDDGNLDYFFALGIDITERQRAQDELRTHRDHLEDLVRQRTDKLTKINRRLAQEIERRREAHKALQQSEAMFEAIFDQTFQLIGILDLKGTVVKINKTALGFAGTTLSHVIGHPFWETPWWAAHPKEHPRLRKAIQDAAQGRLVRFEALHTAHDGHIHTIDFSIKPIKDEHGRNILLVAEGRDITAHKVSMEDLKNRESELKAQSTHLEEANIALKVVLKQVEEKRKEDNENILAHVKQSVIPYVERLKGQPLQHRQQVLLGILEANLNDVTSPLISRLSSSMLNLTPMEIRIAQLVKEGLTNKEIAELLTISLNTVSSHRYRIRTKLGLKKKGTNLRSYLLSLIK